MRSQEDGLLSLTSTDSSRIYEIPVKVTDADRISSAKTFALSDGLLISETFVSDHSPLLTLGEPGYFDIDITNTGASAISELTLQLIPMDSTVQMSDSISSVAGIDPGQTIRLNQAFAFSLDHFYRDNYLVPFRIKAVSGQSDWTKDISVNVHTPVIGLSQPVIDDGANQHSRTRRDCRTCY